MMERWPEITLILAGGLAAMSIILWFAFGMRQVIGELSGRTARRKIREMQRRQPETQQMNRQIVRKHQKSERQDEQKTEILTMRGQPESERQDGQNTEVLIIREGMQSGHWDRQDTKVLTSGCPSGVDNKTELLSDAGRLSLSQQRSERRKDE